MKLTDRIRKRLNDYQFEHKKKLSDVHKEVGIHYETLRSFWNAETEGTGNTLNKLDEFLENEGY